MKWGDVPEAERAAILWHAYVLIYYTETAAKRAVLRGDATAAWILNYVECNIKP